MLASCSVAHIFKCDEPTTNVTNCAVLLRLLTEISSEAGSYMQWNGQDEL
jgi:hypothetical protein